MRLLRTNSDGSFSLTWFVGDRIPRYAILSHRWEEDNHEVTLEDLSNGLASSRKGYKKIQFCGEQAKKDGLEFFWVDSCCIDKTSSAELSEAINSMFRWYRKAAKCYVYLSDVTGVDCSQPQWQSAFRQSTWFTRGWTLQELLAPRSVEFFSYDNERLGDKVSLEQQIHESTGIAVQALRGMPLAQFSLDERLQWMVNRKTTIEEDFAYCLLGVLNIHMPLLYGEGAENACFRLFEEINKRSGIYLFHRDWSGVKIDPTPLLLAARLGMATLVKLLLEGDARVDLEDPQSGRTPLSWAAGSGHEAIVKLLLAIGKVDINSKDQHGRTPLSWAAESGHETVVKLLLEAEAGVNLKDNCDQTPLWLAMMNGHEAVVKLLLATGRVDVGSKDQYGRTLLSLSAKRGHEAVVKLLLATGKFNIDLKDFYGQTPLSLAAKGGHEAVVKLLLATGKFNIDLKDLNGRTPLSWAAESGYEAVVKLLLEAEADINLKDNCDQTPLWLAMMNGHEAVVKLLLATGRVDVGSKDQYGRTLLSLSAKRGHEAVVKLLLATGKFDINSKDRQGRTPLSWAAESGHEAVVKLLLATGKVDVGSKDRYGQTPLSLAVKGEHKAIVKLLKSFSSR